MDDLAEVESSALDQLRNTANLPWVHGLSAMPDVHWGNGATVGSVIVNRGALSPSVVGVDIGCGMCAVYTGIPAQALGDLKTLRSSIERSIPVGFNQNSKVSNRAGEAFKALGPASERAEKFLDKAAHQLGSLGGGNHFVEICLDKLDYVWVMLHSGSRNIGKELAEYHIRKAKGCFADVVKEFGHLEIDPDLAALLVGSREYNDYISDLYWCQSFARSNRDEMMLRVLKDLSYHVYGEDVGPRVMTQIQVNCHHNYIESMDVDGIPSLVTRKGAVSAKAGELGIIPGSMGARSFIVRGKGSADSYCSCSHGAGRRMSRGAAKRAFTVDDLEKQTQGVECRKDAGVLDEIPGAYKDIQKVMDSQTDLVEVVAELRQVVCVKG